MRITDTYGDMVKRPLRELLTGAEPSSDEEMEMEVEDDFSNDEVNPDLCVECGDQPRELVCLGCDEGFCEVCFGYLHRTGKRRQHSKKSLLVNSKPEATGKTQPSEKEKQPDSPHEDEDAEEVTLEATHVDKAAVSARFMSLAKFVPMRLTFEERKLFRLLEAALNVSEYTDKVDIYAGAKSRARRQVTQLREVCTVLTGLVVANGMETGLRLVTDKEFAVNADWYKGVFEIGRRYKIMNPERMRSSFGKLMYMIQDSRLPEVREALEFDLWKPIVTVHDYLSDKNSLAVLEDPDILDATMEIHSNGKTRRQIQQEIRRKENAIEKLSRRYGENVRDALYSIGDFHSFLNANRTPVDAMIHRLKTQFDRDNVGEYSLGISMGRGGARLSHGHAKQYQYVLQSLTLWSEIMQEMYRLWKLSDDDLLSTDTRYILADTGQGLNRIKASPRLYRAMHNIIAQAQKNTGSWVGSSVVHLGDHAVPNSLFFLDKYLQVPRILNPVNIAIKLLPSSLEKDTYAYEWVNNQFGSIETLEKVILTDFFRHAFDGSGADNFYDAGSCIDGRLTSAWNWANSIASKPYYKHFLITGFVGFDGTEGF